MGGCTSHQKDQKEKKSGVEGTVEGIRRGTSVNIYMSDKIKVIMEEKQCKSIVFVGAYPYSILIYNHGNVTVKIYNHGNVTDNRGNVLNMLVRVTMVTMATLIRK